MSSSLVYSDLSYETMAWIEVQLEDEELTEKKRKSFSWSKFVELENTLKEMQREIQEILDRLSNENQWIKIKICGTLTIVRNVTNPMPEKSRTFKKTTSHHRTLYWYCIFCAIAVFLLFK